MMDSIINAPFNVRLRWFFILTAVFIAVVLTVDLITAEARGNAISSARAAVSLAYDRLERGDRQPSGSSKIDALLAEAERKEGAVEKHQIVDSYSTFFGTDATVELKVQRTKGVYLEKWFFYDRRPAAFMVREFNRD